MFSACKCNLFCNLPVLLAVSTKFHRQISDAILFIDIYPQFVACCQFCPKYLCNLTSLGQLCELPLCLCMEQLTVRWKFSWITGTFSDSTTLRKTWGRGWENEAMLPSNIFLIYCRLKFYINIHTQKSFVTMTKRIVSL